MTKYLCVQFLSLLVFCLVVNCQEYTGEYSYGQKDSAAYQSYQQYNGPLYSADYYAPPTPKTYDNNYGSNYDNGGYSNDSYNQYNNYGQNNYDNGGYQQNNSYGQDYNNGGTQYDSSTPPSPNNNNYYNNNDGYNKYDGTTYPPGPNTNDQYTTNPYDATNPPSPNSNDYYNNQFEAPQPPGPNTYDKYDINTYDASNPPAPNTNDYYNNNQYDATTNNNDYYNNNNNYDQYQNSPPSQYSDVYGQQSNYDGYYNTPPAPQQQQSNYDKNYNGNYYMEVVSPPVSYPPPPAIPNSDIPVSTSTDLLFTFLKELVGSQLSLTARSDIGRLGVDSEGYWGNDIVEGWQGNVQNQDLQTAYQERASLDNSYTMLAAGVLDFANVCTDNNPYNMVRSCREIANDGKCWEQEFVQAHVCDKTCGRQPCPNVCDDLLPEDFEGVYQCWELVSECDTQFMIDNNYCASTCKRAPCALP